MRKEIEKYALEAYDIVKHAANKIGSRLPGSENERKYAEYMGNKLREIGIEPKTEQFTVSPRASIGGIPYAGWCGIILSILVYPAMHLSSLWYLMAMMSIVTIVWLVLCVFLYKPWFDMFFKQEISQNTYGELLPQSGKYDYTIILSGHTDTSWNWKHSENSYKYRNKPLVGMLMIYAKVGFGAICFFFLAAVSIAMMIINILTQAGNPSTLSLISSASFMNFITAMHFLPLVTAIGCAFVVMWNDPDPNNASPGAMDNATGCALSYVTTKYFKDNPDKMPKNCRIIDFNCGSEEAGLRGSMAFTKYHKGEEILQNAWHINIDSVADKDYFEVVIKDDWQFTRFDKDLEQMFKEAFKELGIESKTGGCIHNPVGGCDSTPMTKAGIKSVTFAAQNPVLTYYYHTWRDKADRFEPETVATGLEVILKVIEKIEKFEMEKTAK